jgi:hypothetical protein
VHIRAQIRFYTNDIDWLCFKHAVHHALELHEDVYTDIDDFNSDSYMGSLTCPDCK